MRTRPWRRWLLWLAGGGIALILLLAAGIAWLAYGSLPQVSGRARLAGLERAVRIDRDRYGIPRVQAPTAADAYRALGYLHGQDRLWQMDFHRRLGQGRLAEILGEAGLPMDRFMRTLGLARHAEAALPNLAPQTRDWLQAYADGVNAAIASFGWHLPPEFLILRTRPEPWRPRDSLLFLKLMALDLSGNWREELLRAQLAQRFDDATLAELWPDAEDAPVTLPDWRSALADLPLDELAAALPPPSPEGIGSNVWVVSGSRARAGLPLLANDPHLRLQIPGPWYLARVEAPGLEVVGATLPATPFVVLGRNREIAWGFTNTGSDTQDLFIERVDPTDPSRYLAPDGWHPFERRTETILVRGSPPVRLEVRLTRHGPVVSDLVPGGSAVAGSGHVLALAWTQLRDTDRTADAGFAIATAADVRGFIAAMDRYQGAQQNMAVADRGGRIAMVSPGLVPVRRSADGTRPVPGWTGAHDWTGTIPAAALPLSLQPPDGLIVNANNRLVDGSYPYFLAATWDPGLRARRIRELLDHASGLNLDAMAAVQLDLRSMLAVDFVRYLPTVEAAPGALREALTALRDWDGVAVAGRPEPLMFTAWYRELATTLYADELGPLFDAYRGQRANFTRHILEEAPIWCDDVATPAVESCAGRSLLAFERAMTNLERTYGASWRDWRWGEAHPALLAHRPFDSIPFLSRLFTLTLPIGGDGSTVAVAQPAAVDEPPTFPAVHAATYRGLYDLADLDRSRFATSSGQSGHPLSRHYRDLPRLWAAGRFVDIAPSAEVPVERLELVPVQTGG